MVEVPDPPRDLSGPSYAGDVAAWHDKRVAIYETVLLSQLADHEVGAFLVWGDPALYGSILRLLGAVAAGGAVAFTVEVVPGISSIQALAAAHASPSTASAPRSTYQRPPPPATGAGGPRTWPTWWSCSTPATP